MSYNDIRTTEPPFPTPVSQDDYDALSARLRGLIVAICEAQEEGGDVALAIDEAGRAVARPANSASVVQYKPCGICTTQSWCETHGCQCYPTEAMCCLDYPRCDCNSPPEPDSAPTLQPCGHPWKAQHDFKCILCSSPGDATYAQLAEEQRFLHGAPAEWPTREEADKRAADELDRLTAERDALRGR